MEVLSMGRPFTAVVVTLVLGASAASAQAPTSQTRQDSEYTDTLYATDQHMGFSIRTTIVKWLGGVDVAREKDAKAANKEGWWGEPVAQVPPELAQPPRSDR
jgi:hypothetical protein